MKKRVFMGLFILSSLALYTKPAVANYELTVASYNITHGNKHDWNTRKPGVCDVMEQLGADVYCLQEVIKENEQFDSIKKTLPGYGYVGKSRNSQIEGISAWHRFVSLFAQDEYCPIFYNKKTIKKLATKTAGINGKGWRSGTLPRIYTAALLRQKATAIDFYAYATHFDNESEDIRIMQAQLTLDDINRDCGDKAVVLTGDFNTTYTGKIRELFTNAGFIHARDAAAKTEGPQETHEKIDKKTNERIAFECDHILIRPAKAFKVDLYKTSDTMDRPTKDNPIRKTSDHNPVSMTFSLNQ